MKDIFSPAIVQAVNPASYTCDVLKIKDGRPLYNVPVLGSTGGIFSNGMAWTQDLHGAVVVIIEVLGKPYILNTVPVQAAPNISTTDSYTGTGYNSAVSMTNTGTGAENTNSSYGSTTSTGYSGGRQTGFLPGDRVISSDGGAELGILSGGLALLKASPLAQIILGAVQHFVRIVARRFELFTDFGTVTFTDGSTGRSGMIIKGGASTSKENKPSEMDPTVWFYMGDVPDAPDKRIVLHAQSTDKESYGVIAFGINGDMEQSLSRDHLLSIGNDAETRIQGSDYFDVDGNQTIQVGGNQDSTIIGNKETVVSGKCTAAYGGNYDMSTGGSATMSSDAAFNINGSGGVNICGPSINFSATKGSAGGASCTMKVASLNIVKA